MKKKKKANRSHTPLDKRIHQGKQIKSPFAKLDGLINWSSWSDDFLPNMLWACTLTGSLERGRYLPIFREVAVRAREHLSENKDATLCHNFLSTLQQSVFNDIFGPLALDEEVHRVISSVTLLDSMPGISLWRGLFKPSGTSQDLWNTLSRGVFACMDHQSEEATDVRWLKVAFIGICGRIIFPPDMSSAVDDILSYPNRGDMRKVRPMIRALEMSLRSAETDTDTFKSIQAFDSGPIWLEMFNKTNCLSLPNTDVKAEDRAALCSEVEEIIDQIIDHFMANIENTSINARLDATFGLVLYSLCITYELASLPSSLLASGRILLRTITENFITLSYLQLKDDATIWLQYRSYGSGQTALAFLKTSALSEAPDYIDMDRLEMLANEDIWFEAKDINLGAWANKNLRAMAQDAGVKDVYDRYYDWTSGFSHAHWGSVRDTVFTTCLNPLHRLHRIPHPMQPMPSVLTDCCKLCNRLLDGLNTLYPKFTPRIRWHKPDAVES